MRGFCAPIPVFASRASPPEACKRLARLSQFVNLLKMVRRPCQELVESGKVVETWSDRISSLIPEIWFNNCTRCKGLAIPMSRRIESVKSFRSRPVVPCVRRPFHAQVRAVGVLYVDRNQGRNLTRSHEPFLMALPGEVGCTSSGTASLPATPSLLPMTIAQVVSRKSFPPDQPVLTNPAAVVRGSTQAPSAG